MQCIRNLKVFKCNVCYKHTFNYLLNQNVRSLSLYYGLKCIKSSDITNKENIKKITESIKSEEQNILHDSSSSTIGKELENGKQKIIDIIDSQIPDLNIPHVKYRPQNYDNPIKKTATILKDDIAQYFASKVRKVQSLVKKEDRSISAYDKDKSVTSSFNIIPEEKEIWPSTCDILIVGGGIMGMSMAYHMKEMTKDGLDVVVVEKDNSYSQASTVRSVGGIRQQFSIPENIQLSQYGMDFLRRSKQLLSIDGEDPVNVDFHPNGYLTLASDEGFEQLKQNFILQREVGAKVQFLSPAHIKERFPWMNVEGVAAGVLGTENEGWFDPWTFLLALRHKSCTLGAKYVHGEFMSAVYKDTKTSFIDEVPLNLKMNLDHAIIKIPNGEERTIKFSKLIIAAGAWSGEIGRRLGLGAEGNKGVFSGAIPIEPRKRFVYCIHSPNGPGLNSPLTIDPNGTYFRREGLCDMYLCGQSPLDEPCTVDLDVDEKFFEQFVWPAIANRVPSFENLKLKSSWAGYYDYNTFDQNGIIGKHPYFENVMIASGFSGHGLQQAAGVGRAMTEYIIYSDYRTIDLSRLAYERIILQEPLFELNIV